MSVLENFKNIPRSPYGGRQGSNVIFFFKFATRSLAGGARVEGGPVALPRATGGLSPHPSGDWPFPSYISILPSFPPHLSPKIQKKREG